DTEDDGGISKVEFFIDDSLVLTDTESPYQYDWNTTQYESNSEHIIKVISYDNSGNSTISQSILLKVDHTSSLPNGGNITSVTYTLTEMTVEWEQSTDGDFNDYKVLYSDTESGDRDTLETYTDKSTTSYTITEFDPLVENWFWVQVTDTLGLSSIGIGMTNELPPPLLPSQILTIEIGKLDEPYDGFFDIKWNKNQDSFFDKYVLQISDDSDFTIYDSTLITNIDDTTYTSGNSFGVTKYFKLVTEGVWGRSVSSDIVQKTLLLTFEKYYDNKDGRNSSIIEIENEGYVFSYSDGEYVNPGLALIDKLGNINNTQILFSSGKIYDLNSDNSSGYKFVVSAMTENNSSEVLTFLGMNADFEDLWSVEDSASSGFGIVNVSDYNDGFGAHYMYVIADYEGGIVFKRLDEYGSLLCTDINNFINQTLRDGRSLAKVTDHIFTVVEYNNEMYIAVDPVDDGCEDNTAYYQVGDSFEYASIEKTDSGELLVLYKINGNIFKVKKIIPNSLDWEQSTIDFSINLPVQLADNAGERPLIKSLSNGNIIVLGSILENIGQSLNSVILLYSADGSLIISKEFENIQLTDAQETSLTGGGIIFTGNNLLGGQSVIIKTDFNLNY
ncbi:MAG: hypothetical protein HOG97_03740, partial [Candidatus Marinimicrobia bacterium]|nr:hypothetical protein [Candidatus Neomarinimicrobiota bacterium]